MRAIIEGRKTKRAPRPRLPLFTGQPVSRERIPSPKEIRLHFSVAGFLTDFCRPDWRWTHFPAGEDRSEETGSKLKRMGTKRGWPDFQLISPTGLYHGLELKRLGEGLNDDQKAFADWCGQHSVQHAVADTFTDAVTTLKAWGCLRIDIAEGSL